MRLTSLLSPVLLAVLVAVGACAERPAPSAATTAEAPVAVAEAAVVEAPKPAVPGSLAGRVLDHDVKLAFVLTANVMGELEPCG